MRKPLVALCVAAAALGAGGIAANALAQESPDGSDVADFSIFEEPNLPGLDGDNLLGPFPDMDVPDSEPMAEPPPRRPRAGSAAEPPLAQSADPIDPVLIDPSPSPSSSPSRVTRRTLPAPVRADEPEPATERPRPRADAELRQRQAPGFARPAADPLAAARTAVSASSVSASPSAPVQQQVLALVNRNRRSHGCGPLSADRRLIEAANRHAADMAQRGYFDHEDPRGDRAGSRVSRAGYDWKRYGENIARGQNTPYEVVTDWMNSPEHRENILDCRMDEVGLGLAFSRGDTPYWVQDFATPR
ncbi:CAP domain-containing protein [Actinoplanes sp. GCM10030250]|uniref:CAP domain-containing protein n=1 Tax=Actinoplanes sp. GCM10030250 TaxID=3273376 RepID=UPI00360BEB87